MSISLPSFSCIPGPGASLFHHFSKVNHLSFWEWGITVPTWLDGIGDLSNYFFYRISTNTFVFLVLCLIVPAVVCGVSHSWSFLIFATWIGFSSIGNLCSCLMFSILSYKSCICFSFTKNLLTYLVYCSCSFLFWSSLSSLQASLSFTIMLVFFKPGNK